MNPLIEGVVAGLLGNLLTELAGSVKKRLSSDPAQIALRASISEALEAALKEANLSPEDFDHIEGFLKDLFEQEAVLIELAQLLDPRPGRTLDFEKLAAELQEAGLDPETLPGFELESFLRNFAVAFYSAAGKQEALRGILNLKFLGQIEIGVRTIAEWSERGALASERMADGMAQLIGEVKELKGYLQRFLEGGISETNLRDAVIALQAAGLIPAFDGWRTIEGTLQASGYDIDIDKEGRLKIEGRPSERRALPPAQLDTLRNLAVDLRQAIAARPPSEDELDSLAERYRQHIIRWSQNLKFHGMTPSAFAIELPLEEVYVELRAVAEIPEAADSFSVEERHLLLEAEDKDPEAKRELLSQLDAFRRERWSRMLPERKSIAVALYQKDRRAFVVLGEPGSGKSTLLQFLALIHARGPETASKRLEIDLSEVDRLPILVPLAAFDDMLRETPGLTLLDFLPRFYDRRRGLPGLGPLFRHVLETGRALILLDGLDEVLDTTTRNYVAQQAGALIGDWSLRGVRFVVSSRFAGYREAPVPGNFPTLSVLDFREKEIEVFVHRWAHAYEKKLAEGEETPEMLRKARELERGLLNDVKSNESVRRLAANPLMITLLALLRRRVSPLPRRRVQLYDAYVSTMLDYWIMARSQGARERSLDTLDPHQAENILIPLAFWLQREKPSGTAGRVELERQLTDICLRDRDLVRERANISDLRGAEEQSRRFLREMREMTGLLVERGHDAFGFLHLTFQEYFTGRKLALFDPGERWMTVRPHLHDPRWREPILLCAGWLGVVENRRDQVTDFISRILNEIDPTESDLHRNLLLALAIACDDVNLSRGLLENLVNRATACLPTEVYAFGRELLESLGRLVINRVASLDACFDPVWAHGDSGLRRVAIEALEKLEKTSGTRDLLLERIEREEDWDVDGAVARALARWIGEDGEVRALLLGRLAHKQDHVRWTTIDALADQVGNDDEILGALQQKLDDPEGFVVSSAVRALGKYAVRDQSIREALLGKIDHEDRFVRVAVLESLATFQTGTAEFREAALRKLEDADDWVRSSAIEALSPVGDRNEIRIALLRMLEDGDEGVRQSAIRSLAGLVHSDSSVRDALVRRISDPDEDVSAEALQVLSGLIDANDLLVHLQEWSRDESWERRYHAAQIAGESSWRGEFLALLRSVRESAATSKHVRMLIGVLPALGSSWLDGDERAERIVSEGLSHHDWRVRRAAVRALVDRARRGLDVKAALLQKLDDDVMVARVAARGLAEFLEEDGSIREILLERLQRGPSSLLRYPFSRAVSREVTNKELRSQIEGLELGPHLRTPAREEDLVERAMREADGPQELIELFHEGDDLGREVGALALVRSLSMNHGLEAVVIDTLMASKFKLRLKIVDEIVQLDSSSLGEAIMSQLWAWLSLDVRVDFRVFHDFDEDRIEDTRRKLADVLGARLPSGESLALVNDLLQSPRLSSRLGAILALLSWPGGPPQEQVELIWRALDDNRDLESYPARLMAASFLINRDSDAAASIDLCLEALDYGTQPWEYLPNSKEVRKQAILILGKLEPLEHNQRVYDRLLRVMKEDEDPDVRDAAYNALVRLAGVRDRQAAVA